MSSSKKMSTNKLTLTCGRYLKNYRAIRGGVIPYTISPGGKLYYLLARHSETGELGDFGGGIKKTERLLDGALREFFEETNGIFGTSMSKNRQDYDDRLVLVDATAGGRMFIMFLPIDCSWLNRETINNKFSQSKRRRLSSGNEEKAFSEISELVWVDEASFEKLIGAPKEKWLSRNIISAERVSSISRNQRIYGPPDGRRKREEKLWKFVKNFFFKTDDIKQISEFLKSRNDVTLSA